MEVILSVAFVAILVAFLALRNKSKEKASFRDFKDLRAILDYHCEQAYQSVYKSRILVYSINATKLVGKELDEVKKEYCNLALKLLGPKLVLNLRDVYSESLLFNIVLYFEEKYDEDEIYRSALNNFKKEMDVEEHGS